MSIHGTNESNQVGNNEMMWAGNTREDPNTAAQEMTYGEMRESNIPMYTEYGNNEQYQQHEDPTQVRYESVNMNERGNSNAQANYRQFPRQVMTALGPLPLPEEFKHNIPEKFVAKPIIEEREIYVSKKERKQREVEVPHVQYEHTFQNIKKQFKVSKLIPSVSEVVKEIPKEVLKPVIEEKIIEVPQGVKYVEVPVEVPCLYPPKIVPKVVTQYVERIVETVKPVVQEKIIEVPQTVIKQVPKIKTVEVPYFVPRYVEKIVEVPFRPNGEMPRIQTKSPFSISKTLPPLKPTHYMNHKFNNTMEINQMNHMQKDENSQMEFPQSHDMFKGMSGENYMPSMMQTQNSYMNQTQEQFRNAMPPMQMPSFNSQYNPHFNINPNARFREGIATQVENLQNRINLPDGIQWGYPEGVNKPVMQHNSQVPPLVVTCPPEIGRVTCARKDIQPDILTKGGVYEFEGFKKKGTAQALFPPLAPHNQVPFLPPPAAPGTPDVRTLEKTKMFA